MRALRKQTVQAFILLARSCGHLDFGVDSDITLPGVDDIAKIADDPHLKAFNQFLDELSKDELAELTALFWLGRDPQVRPEDWDDLVENATRVRSDDLYRASKVKLPQIVRYAMERLARFKRQQKQAKAPRALSDDEIALSERLVGQFTLHAYREKYGSVSGLKKLVDMMDHKGFLEDPEQRRLFNLAPREKDGMEHVLQVAPTARKIIDE